MVWSQHYASADGLDEAAHALALDAADNVYLAGRGNVAGGGSEMLALKLEAATGEVVWVDHRGGSAALDDVAWDVVVGPDGNPVVTGMVVQTGGAALAVTRKLAGADGVLIWENPVVGALNEYAAPGSWLALLDDGDVVLCERVYGANGYDFLLERYAAADGAEAWAVRYDGASHGGDDARGLVRDAAGDLIVFGVQDTFWNYNYMVVKFAAADGSLVWEAPGYDGPPGWYDVAASAAIGAGGEIVVTGLSDGIGTGWDIATIGCDPATGTIDWVHRFDGSESATDEGRSVAVASGGEIYVTGYSYAGATGKDLLVMKLSPAVVSAVPDEMPAATRLAAPWPNPFNPRVNLAFALEQAGPVRLTVHDPRGGLVATLLQDRLDAGAHTAAWDGRDGAGRPVAAGVYFVRLDAGGTRTSRKVVLVE